MIPLILADPATGTGKPAPKTEATADGAEATAFGDLMTDAEVPDGDARQTAAVDPDGVVIETEVETVEFTAPPVDGKRNEAETKPTGPLLADLAKPPRPGADATAASPEMGAAKPDPRTPAPADAADTAVAKAMGPVKDDKSDLPVRAAKTQRSSVAQSVMEGKLPQAPPAETPKTATPAARAAVTPRADVDRPPPPAAQPAAQMEPQLRPNTDDVAKAVVAQTAAETPRQRREEMAQAPVLAPASKPATPTAAVAQPPAVARAQAAAQPLRDTTEKTAKASLSEATITSAPIERQGGATTTVQAAPTASATPDMARQVATQVAVAVNNTTGKTTEIALNPEELGRVRLSLSAADGAIVLNVLAERPETQDLLRRNMDMLAQEFRQLGYTTISFTFGDQKGDARPDDAQHEDTVEREAQETSETSPIIATAQTTGLDLRI